MPNPPLPDRCDAIPPGEANNFSDGTLKMPRIHFLSFGAFGTWHPARNIAEEPLHNFEKEFGYHQCEGQGVAICGPIKGQRGSSTRGELGAGIMGIYAPKAIHQASDSMAYVRKGTQILNGSYDRKRKKSHGVCRRMVIYGSIFMKR